MTELEQRALKALTGVTMRPYAGGKRFLREMEPRMERKDGYQLTERQAWYLWFQIYTYRRQIHDAELVGWGKQVKEAAALPDALTESGTHRPPAAAARKPKIKSQAAGRPLKPTRLETEMARGGGRLQL
jgi:hypothetical protein